MKINAKKLTDLRKLKKMTLAELEKQCRVSSVTLAAIERGGDTKVSTLAKIAAALGVRIRYFFDESNYDGEINPEPLDDKDTIIKLQDELIRVKADLINCQNKLIEENSVPE